MNTSEPNNQQPTTVVVKAINEGGVPGYQWFDGQQVQTGKASQLADAIGQQAIIEIVVPAEYCSIKHYAFDSSESKVLRQTLPYSLEDELLSDVDELHFALGAADNNKVPVAIIATQLVQAWLDDIQALTHSHELEVKRVTPELVLLPWLEQQWTLCVDTSEPAIRYLLRSSAFQGFALPEGLFSQAVALLIKEQGLPSSVVLYCDDEQRDAVKEKLPEALRDLVLWQSGNYWALISENQQPQAELNLLQAVFSRSLPWRKYWLQWRAAGALAAVLVAAQMSYAYIENNQLVAKNVSLRSQIETAYRSAIPKGAVIDPEKQLKRKVAAMQGGTGEGFVALLSKIATVTQSVDGFTVQSMNYSEKQNEVRLTVLANSFKDVESVRSQLQKQGVQAELTGSSSEAGKTRARLRIRG